jgi:acetolactate synthase-1/2/3 large subunit
MRAADVMMECLRREGVDVIFGLPGGAALPTYDAIHQAGIRHIHCRHEQGAGHAAEGYAKASGKVGVVFATSGPGATNLVTAIADAQMDSVPLVCITGQVRSDLIGTDGFQEADITGITLPIVKHSVLVEDPALLPQTIHEAFHIARSGRPGPVLIDIPQDIARAELDTYSTAIDLPGYAPTTVGHPQQIRQAAHLLANAERPVLYVGGGAVNADAADQIGRLIARGRFPATATLMGLGAVDGGDPHWLGMLGMHGTRTANYSIDQADLVVAIGARFDDRITGRLDAFAQQAKFIHIDIDPAEINKNVPAHVPIVGDVRVVLEQLLEALAEVELAPERLDRWWVQIRAWQQEYPLAWQARTEEILPQQLVVALAQATQGEAIICSDVGQHQMWAAQFYPFPAPRRWINSGGLGTMGFGLPAAIGAAVACPERTVVALSGEGSLQMNVQELATAAIERIPVKIIVANNDCYGMVRQWQELFWEGRYEAVDMHMTPDWVQLAGAYRIPATRVRDPAELDQALLATLNRPGPALLDVIIRREENVWPMIPTGAAARDMIG